MHAPRQTVDIPIPQLNTPFTTHASCNGIPLGKRPAIKFASAWRMASDDIHAVSFCRGVDGVCCWSIMIDGSCDDRDCV